MADGDSRLRVAVAVAVVAVVAVEAVASAAVAPVPPVVSRKRGHVVPVPDGNGAVDSHGNGVINLLITDH